MQLSKAQKPKTLADIIRSVINPTPRKTIMGLAADAGVDQWHINKILGGRSIHLTSEVYEGLRKALGLSHEDMQAAVAAQKEAMASSPVLHNRSKELVVRRMGKNK